MNIDYYKQSRMLLGAALIVAQAALVSTYAGETSENRGQLSAADYKFAKAAACGGTMEVNLGKLAAEKSSNVSVQQFGQRMVTDHGKAGQELEQIASRKGASLPTQLTTGHQKEIDRLGKLSGSEFDKAYMNLMVRDHKADEKEFKRASEHLQDPDLKAFAASTLTVVQDHLKMAEDLAGTLKHEVSMNK